MDAGIRDSPLQLRFGYGDIVTGCNPGPREHFVSVSASGSPTVRHGLASLLSGTTWNRSIRKSNPEPLALDSGNFQALDTTHSLGVLCKK